MAGKAAGYSPSEIYNSNGMLREVIDVLGTGSYGDVDRWSRMSILNTARSGKFSSDRDYSRLIWHVDGMNVANAGEP